MGLIAVWNIRPGHRCPGDNSWKFGGILPPGGLELESFRQCLIGWTEASIRPDDPSSFNCGFVVVCRPRRRLRAC